MSTNPVVTVITPSYNQAQFLESTLCSVLDQDYPALEYIVIDGGSKDGSVDIIRRYESHLAYWVSEPDSGQSDAINKGLVRASGKYVTWLNSDDIHLPGAIFKAVAALERTPEAGMVYANGIGIDSEGNQTDWPHYGQYSLLDLLCMHIIHQPTVFMRKEVVQAVGGLDPTYHLLMDHHLWSRIARIAPIFFVDEYWAAARRHAHAKNTTRRSDFAVEARRILGEMSQHPDVAELIKRHARQIEAGHRIFEAIYSLADDQATLALLQFLSAVRTDPSSVRRCWRLIVLSLAQATHLRWGQSVLYSLRARSQERRYNYYQTLRSAN
ncbi:MAG: glycosyltransferase [Ardenticatenaceae bacterium]|nr:glycosyltransferase [Ardenticatenaceae bacterium]